MHQITPSFLSTYSKCQYDFRKKTCLDLYSSIRWTFSKNLQIYFEGKANSNCRGHRLCIKKKRGSVKNPLIELVLLIREPILFLSMR